MKSKFLGVVAIVFAAACTSTMNEPQAEVEVRESQRSFATADEAADALVKAADRYDVPELLAILGPDAKDLVTSADRAGDRERARTFAQRAKEKRSVAPDPNESDSATLLVGNEDWPLPIPLVESDGRWHFDAKAGRDEILRRRIGENELDAITVSRGYVEAQQEYARTLHDDSRVNQYAQRIISTPGKQDGLAWQEKDGTWSGPVGPAVAKALEQGTKLGEPYHGYRFKILKGQGPAARLGEMDYTVGGAMIGGFALVAYPAEYGVTGVKTFMVSYDGVVYQKDLGKDTAVTAAAIERYNPDDSWRRTDDEW